MTQVLIVEPDASVRAELRGILENNGFGVAEPSGTGLDAHMLESMDYSAYPCIVASAEGCRECGIDVLSVCHEVPVILLARQPDVACAVDAMKRGASDYLTLPVDSDALAAAVERCIAERRSHGIDLPTSQEFPMVGDSAPMRELYDRIRKVGPTDSTVLIRGESGSGKELVARALHAASRRAHAPMISLNCATVPPRIIETELFGYSPSAGRGDTARRGLLEAADGGTLFLDEIGELGMEAQARLLRVLQAGELRRFGSTETLAVDVRLITATHRDLDKLIKNGQFREDLFYRLNVVALEVPPLRERGEDVLLLAEAILERARAKLGKPALYFGEAARQAMLDYSWPGNVRELENAIERAVILCDDDTIAPELLAIDGGRGSSHEAPPGSAEQTSLEDYFVSFVLAHQDSLTETELAEKLGISRKSLWERRQRLNIPRKRTRQRGPRRDAT
ncbi:MAG: AAA domain-containing protein [Gammaproteobacteria bacterium]|jgi:DNA-binding NtrC family response regulator|nr:AAA domain-containing protein [Gammaproteobacteria bacterium]